MSEKKTYGQVLIEHQAKNLTRDDDVIEYRRVWEKDVVKNIYSTLAQAKATEAYHNRDFYIILLNRVERIGQAPQTWVFARLSCPTPVYKQSVWKYHRKGENLEFLWTIPDVVLYYHCIRNAPKLLQDKETAGLTKFVLLMESGELLDWVKKENGEKQDAIIKIES